jgi:hypothetical protein
LFEKTYNKFILGTRSRPTTTIQTPSFQVLPGLWNPAFDTTATTSTTTTTVGSMATGSIQAAECPSPGKKNLIGSFFLLFLVFF